MTLSPESESNFAKLMVSREAMCMLARYAELLSQENEKHNLVASSTIPLMWERHFLDSAQLLPLLPPQAQSLVDIGSGAGFPGLVLAILTGLEVHLVESVGKKAAFLQKVAAELAPKTIIHHARAEEIDGLRADIVTARAVTALPELLGYAKKFWGKDTVGLFLKGEKADAELTAAGKYWTFEADKVPSLTDPSGAILKIVQLKARKPHVSGRNAR